MWSTSFNVIDTALRKKQRGYRALIFRNIFVKFVTVRLILYCLLEGVGNIGIKIQIRVEYYSVLVQKTPNLVSVLLLRWLSEKFDIELEQNCKILNLLIRQGPSIDHDVFAKYEQWIICAALYNLFADVQVRTPEFLWTLYEPKEVCSANL